MLLFVRKYFTHEATSETKSQDSRFLPYVYGRRLARAVPCEHPCMTGKLKAKFASMLGFLQPSGPSISELGTLKTCSPDCLFRYLNLQKFFIDIQPHQAWVLLLRGFSFIASVPATLPQWGILDLRMHVVISCALCCLDSFQIAFPAMPAQPCWHVLAYAGEHDHQHEASSDSSACLSAGILQYASKISRLGIRA